MVRTIADGLEARYQDSINEEHPILPWVVRHAAATLNRYLKGPDGRTPYSRLKGRNFRTEVAEFGECIWYLKPESKGKTKLKSRWETGIWLGIREESGETLIGTKEGVIKVRSFREKGTNQERWNQDVLKEMKGTPWQPVPGR